MQRFCSCALALSLLAFGCTTGDGDPADDLAANEQGLTEVRIDARALLNVGITQVTLEAAGQSQDLVLNASTGTFDGSLFLPAGPQSLVARAFAGATLVGASNSTQVQIQSGQVTRVVMRILDLTGSAPPVYGPILDSLVFPATAQATAPVAFAASVVAPAGDPVSYAWSSSCADSTFSAPDSATTSWSKTTQGSCTISMLATSNGFSVGQSFQIVVFPTGTASGAVDTSALFVSAPSIYFGFPDTGCYVLPGSNSSCGGSIASPSITSYGVNVMGWGGSTPGSITVSDNCGGHFGMTNSGPDYRSGSWLPPSGAGVCILTASATNGDGLVSTLSAALLVRAGTPATAQPPSIWGQLYPGFNCYLDSSLATPMDCGSIPAGAQMSLYGYVSWSDGTPGSITLVDSCSSGLQQPSNAYNFSSYWNLPNLSGQTCTLTAQATNLQGGTSQTSVQYHLQ
jgi:hypothetical protein